MFFRAHTLYFTGRTLRNLLETSGFKIVSQSPDASDNLSVVAQYVNAPSTSSMVEKNHPLVTAQIARRWGPYLLQQLQDGQPLRKWRVRQEEKHTAKQYANGQVLLNDLYEKKSQQMLTV
jgi:hypothetical protein